jgi:hypothetical protein
MYATMAGYEVGDICIVQPTRLFNPNRNAQLKISWSLRTTRLFQTNHRNSETNHG